MRQIVFIAGPLRSPDVKMVAAHVLTAKHAATDLAALGVAPYCPHAAIGFSLGKMHEADAEAINNTFLHLAHAVYALPGCERSLGARRELVIAAQRGIPIFHSLQEVRAWRASLR